MDKEWADYINEGTAKYAFELEQENKKLEVDWYEVKDGVSSLARIDQVEPND